MNMKCIISGLILSFGMVLTATAQGEFSLEEVMDYGFPYELTTSRTGDMAAWVENRKGVRNIFISKGAGMAKQVTHDSREEGQELGELVFSADNRYMYYTKGGAPNGEGEIPNPLSLPKPPKREIWRVNLEDGAIDRFSEGHTPLLSNRGDMLVFIRNGEVWITGTGSGDQPAFLFSARGDVESLVWSPDDRNVAFVSDRSDHAFIGIYLLEENRIIYPDPGVDNDGHPVWSPDGRYIAFVRIPHQHNLPFTPRRSAIPWSIRIVDLQEDSAREVWKAPEGTGSAFRDIPGSDQLFWTAGDHLVFPWEGDGWSHLYMIQTDGTGLRLLTPGESEIQQVTLSRDRKQLAYASNQGDIDRMHIWSIRLPGGEAEQVTGGPAQQVTKGEAEQVTGGPAQQVTKGAAEQVTGGPAQQVTKGAAEQVTKGNGIEWSPRFSSPGNRLYLLASGPVTPGFAAVIQGGRHRSIRQEKVPSGYPSDQLVQPEPVTYSTADGMQIRGQLFLPPGMKKNTQYPAVIFLHGGSRRQMLLGFHPMDYYHHAYAFNQYLASRGYVVFSINFRSGTGYGMEFREALNYGPRGASEFQDVLGAGHYLRGRPEVDGERIGLWGGSYGGYLTALGLARASDLFAAGVDLHGVHDWNEDMPSFHPGFDPLKYPDAAELAHISSPIAYVDDWESPVLLIHGDDDPSVFFNQTVLLVEELRKNEVPFEQLILPDEVHGFLLHRSWLKAYRAAYDFLERHLKELL